MAAKKKEEFYEYGMRDIFAKMDAIPPLTPEICRAGRGWLNWSQSQLALNSGLSTSTVRDFEKGRHVATDENRSAMQKAMRNHGLSFFQTGDSFGLGVRKEVPRGLRQLDLEEFSLGLLVSN